MNSKEIISNLGVTSTADQVLSLFAKLNTLNRPKLPEREECIYHDWVLVRRKGVELGFTDSEYQTAAARLRWGHGQLLLTQVYFYSEFSDIQTFVGELPFNLEFSDNESIARTKLSAFDSTRRSYINDAWDIGGYRLSIVYKNHKQSIDRIVYRILPTPIPSIKNLIYPVLANIINSFGDSIREVKFAALWGNLLDDKKLDEAVEDGEIDLTQTYGATLGLAGEERSVPVLRSIIFHRNRDSESVCWSGELPMGLAFDDSPEILFSKVTQQPVQQSDSAHTGHAVWHFTDYTLHVLYSNLDNCLLRIKLIAPGSWRCIAEE
jgi:hypothetical protein